MTIQTKINWPKNCAKKRHNGTVRNVMAQKLAQ
jgi:hypothetical protein